MSLPNSAQESIPVKRFGNLSCDSEPRPQGYIPMTSCDYINNAYVTSTVQRLIRFGTFNIDTSNSGTSNSGISNSDITTIVCIMELTMY